VGATSTGKLKVVAVSEKVHKLLKDHCIKKGLKIGIATENIIRKYFEK
tara:strand:- start:408 stop:551 length:144 start_codon:yes stop_codon:yes gene_type:complete